MKSVTLTKQITIDGKDYKKLNFDFESLTAKDFFTAERQARGLGEITPNIQWGLTYRVVVAVMCCKEPLKFEDIRDHCSFRDMSKIAELAADFLQE
ncbi:hypothetical protein [Veillonella magna]|uniref:hypothetical protein n=1 Tax=Veillonella magna TaxID=464322 RepID=UPI0023F4BE66|nr:hypothetical protein [Veillonella magna]